MKTEEEKKIIMEWWNEMPLQDIINCKNGWANLVMVYYPDKTDCQDVTLEEIMYMYDQEHLSINDKESDSRIEHDGVIKPVDYNLNLKERLEEKNKAVIIDFDGLRKIAGSFSNWLKDLVMDPDKYTLMFKTETGFRCNIYSNDHVYSFYGYVPGIKNIRGYLGAGATLRKSKVGEDWHRGNDLPDGEYSKETFDKIVSRIVKFGLEPLELWR